MRPKSENQPLRRLKWVKPKLVRMQAGSAENATANNPDGQFTTS